jgi:hypothetical protein
MKAFLLGRVVAEANEKIRIIIAVDNLKMFLVVFMLAFSFILAVPIKIECQILVPLCPVEDIYIAPVGALEREKSPFRGLEPPAIVLATLRA